MTRNTMHAQCSACSVRLSIQPPHFSSNVTSLLLLLKPVSCWGPGTCPHLDLTSSGLLQNLIPLQLFHLEGSTNGDVFDGASFLKRKSPIKTHSLKCHMFEGIISHTLHHDRDGNLVRFMAHGIRSHFSSSEITPGTSGEHKGTKWHNASWKR